MTDAFGLVALVAMMPLITVQVMGAIYVIKSAAPKRNRLCRTSATTRSSNCGRPADMELYYIIAVTDSDRGEAMNALFRETGLPMILSAPGRGTAKNEHLAVYGLDETPKTVTTSVASAQEAAQLVKAAKRKLFLDIPGNGILLTVPLKSVAGGRTLAYLTNDLKTGGTPHMEFNHELIVVILNEGYADLVMDAARPQAQAAAQCCTPRGTGSKRGEKFFGVSLADEKDMVHIM